MNHITARLNALKQLVFVRLLRGRELAPFTKLMARISTDDVAIKILDLNSSTLVG